MLAAIRVLNRPERMGETLRAARNDLAAVAPGWLRARVPPDWFERDGPRFEAHRLPKDEGERRALAEAIGRDGFALPTALFMGEAPPCLREVPSIDMLRRTWLYQYWVDDGIVRWRKADDLPPPGCAWTRPTTRRRTSATSGRGRPPGSGPATRCVSPGPATPTRST